MKKEMTPKQIEAERTRLTIELKRAELNLFDFELDYPEGYCHPMFAKRMKLEQKKEWEELTHWEEEYKQLLKEAEYEKTTRS